MNPTLRLALRLASAQRLKNSLLVLLVAMTMSVFVLVTALSRLAQDELARALVADLGEPGTYRIDFSDDLGLDRDRVVMATERVFGSYDADRLEILEVLPATSVHCPEPIAEELRPLTVRWSENGRPLPLPYGVISPGVVGCLDGLVLDGFTPVEPSPSDERLWGMTYVVDARYRDIALSATTGPVTYSVVFATGRDANESQQLRLEIAEYLEAYGPYEKPASQLVVVSRIDSNTGGISRAARGSALVYDAIRWGVLGLGALGLLVSELIVVRDRSKFFGLGMALGARRRQIAALVTLDVALILVGGLLFALGIVAIASPEISRFSVDAFGVDLDVGSSRTWPQVALGALAVLIVAAAYPAARAVRSDPLDVLEPKSS